MSDDVAMDSHEHREHAEHAAHDPFLQRVSVTIALLAVISATISSLENNQASEAIAARNEAVLHQDKASDSWAFFQAKTIKEAMFAIAADNGGARAKDYRSEATRHKGAIDGAKAQAESEEAKSAASEKRGDELEARAHRLSMSETFSHVAIAVATIAIVTQRRWPWLAAIGIGGVAIAIATSAFALPNS
jgi:hypothetical protein